MPVLNGAQGPETQGKFRTIGRPLVAWAMAASGLLSVACTALPGPMRPQGPAGFGKGDAAATYFVLSFDGVSRKGTGLSDELVIEKVTFADGGEIELRRADCTYAKGRYHETCEFSVPDAQTVDELLGRFEEMAIHISGPGAVAECSIYEQLAADPYSKERLTYTSEATDTTVAPKAQLGHTDVLALECPVKRDPDTEKKGAEAGPPFVLRYQVQRVEGGSAIGEDGCGGYDLGELWGGGEGVGKLILRELIIPARPYVAGSTFLHGYWQDVAESEYPYDVLQSWFPRLVLEFEIDGRPGRLKVSPYGLKGRGSDPPDGTIPRRSLTLEIARDGKNYSLFDSNWWLTKAEAYELGLPGPVVRVVEQTPDKKNERTRAMLAEANNGVSGWIQRARFRSGDDVSALGELRIPEQQPLTMEQLYRGTLIVRSRDTTREEARCHVHELAAARRDRNPLKWFSIRCPFQTPDPDASPNPIPHYRFGFEIVPATSHCL